MVLSDNVLIAIITAAGGIASGVFGKSAVDHFRKPKTAPPPTARSEIASVEGIIARRAEIEFQTRMTLMLEKLSEVLETSNDRMEIVGRSIGESALAIRDVHRELMRHEQRAEGATAVLTDTNGIVKNIQQIVKDLHQDSSSRD